MGEAGQHGNETQLPSPLRPSRIGGETELHISQGDHQARTFQKLLGPPPARPGGAW